MSMIADPIVLADLRADWRAVRTSQDRVARNLAAASSGIGSMGQSHEFRNFAYGLCLLDAFSVLEHALLELRDQGTFVCGRSQLGAVMHASAAALPLQDCSFVEQGRVSRNRLDTTRAGRDRACRCLALHRRNRGRTESLGRCCLASRPTRRRSRRAAATCRASAVHLASPPAAERQRSAAEGAGGRGRPDRRRRPGRGLSAPGRRAI